MTSNFEMGTPLTSLNNNSQTNMNSLVKQVENNLDNFSQKTNEVKETYSPLNVEKDPFVYNPNIPLENSSINQAFKYDMNVPIKKPEVVEVSVEEKSTKKTMGNFISENYKEFLIVVLLFSIFAHKKISKLIIFSLPFLTKFNSPIPFLLLKGFLFSSILFTIKCFIN